MLKLMPIVSHLFTVATAYINVLRIKFMETNEDEMETFCFIETNDAGYSTEMETAVLGLCIRWGNVYRPTWR